jgi:hypothetical protein
VAAVQDVSVEVPQLEHSATAQVAERVLVVAARPVVEVAAPQVELIGRRGLDDRFRYGPAFQTSGPPCSHLLLRVLAALLVLLQVQVPDWVPVH